MKYKIIILLIAAGLAGCTEREPMSVAQFLENEAALYGALVRCENNPAAATEPECRNARQAAERISVIEERAMRKGREQAFSSAREEYRARLDRERELRLRAEAEAEEARMRTLVAPMEEDEDAADFPQQDHGERPPPGVELDPPGEPGAGQVGGGEEAAPGDGE
jgi:hypothetical protein